MNQSTPIYHGANRVPPIVIEPSANQNTIQIVLAVAATLVALLLGLLVLFLIGVETGPLGLLVGMVAATIPVPLYVALVLWIDRYEGEPLWMLVSAFLWGALVTPFFAFIFNTASGLTVEVLADSVSAGETFAAVISAPIVEEIAKALILFVFFFWKKDEFDGVIDGIVYAAMVGLGFAVTENVLYYGRAVIEGGVGLTPVFVVRGMIAPFSHPLFTSMAGIGLGLARQSRRIPVKLGAPIAGLLTAIFLHSIWNGSAAIFGALAFLLTYVVIMVPAFLIMFLVIYLALRREGEIMREFLAPDFECGLLTPQEYSQLCTIKGRMGSSFNAFARGGVGHWRACRKVNQLASELAFHRSRVTRGISTPDAHERESAYQLALRDLLKQLRPS